MDPTGPDSDAWQRHVGAPSAKEPLTSTMAVADCMEDYLRALGHQRAYSVSLRLISSMVGRQRISSKPSAMLLRLVAEFWQN